MQLSAISRQLSVFRTIPASHEERRLSFEVSHPWRKNKGAPRMGHPATCSEFFLIPQAKKR